jgi:tRNA pseudouridine38-40 synthase
MRPVMQRNFRFRLAYDGTAFSGWQIQPNAPTVQGALERALAELTQQPCRVRGAGRTDAGVHAEGQLANVICSTRLSCDRLLSGLNALTPDDIRVLGVEEVSLDFDARRDVSGKHYRYVICNAAHLPPLLRWRAYHVRRELDLAAMARAARQLVGTHDFSAFRAADCERETTHRTLYRCTVGKTLGETIARGRGSGGRSAGAQLMIDVEGTAFLKNMVRIIAGTLIDVGLGRLDVGVIGRLLGSGDRRCAGPTAPARGLTLVEVFLP